MVTLPSQYPLLAIRFIAVHLPAPLGEITTPPWLSALLDEGSSPFPPRPPQLAAAVRDCLRFGGFKPAGRSKPSSEYLLSAAREGRLAPINPLVDIGNAISLHSGLPISVIDRDKTHPPLSVQLAQSGQKYVFNASGQEIDVAGLLCLFDAVGPCANPVKDAQRTKTDGMTIDALVIIWGVALFANRTDTAQVWCRELLEKAEFRIVD